MRFRRGATLDAAAGAAIFSILETRRCSTLVCNLGSMHAGVTNWFLSKFFVLLVTKRAAGGDSGSSFGRRSVEWERWERGRLLNGNGFCWRTM